MQNQFDLFCIYPITAVLHVLCCHCSTDNSKGNWRQWLCSRRRFGTSGRRPLSTSHRWPTFSTRDWKI